MRWRTTATAALLLTAGVAQGKSLHEGDVAPDAALRMVDGSTVHLADLRGQVVVLNIWATWCVPCRRELPLLDTYYRIQKPHGLAVYAATTEDSVSPSALKPLFGALSIRPVRGLKGPYEPIGGAVPTNYVIDRAGRIRYMKAGAFDLDALNSVLVPLLREPAPAPSS